MPGFHFHWLHHGFASLMAAWGLLGEFPLYVAAQMGHADANTTMRYAKLLKEGVRLNREETLRRLHAVHTAGRSCRLLTQCYPASPCRWTPMRKTRVNTDGPAWARTRNSRLMSLPKYPG